MNRVVVALIQCALFVLPWSIRRRAMIRLFGYKIDPSARIGLSLVVVGQLKMAPQSSIGDFNFIHGLERLELGEGALLGKFNWVAGLRSHERKFFQEEKSRQSVLTIGDFAAVTSQHFVDCTDSVEVGAFSNLGGARSQILTHEIDIVANRQTCAPVRIGRYSLIGTGSIILKGSTVADYCVLGAGSVYRLKVSEPFGLYVGTPAQRVRELPHNAAYFLRNEGVVL